MGWGGSLLRERPGIETVDIRLVMAFFGSDMISSRSGLIG